MKKILISLMLVFALVISASAMADEAIYKSDFTTTGTDGSRGPAAAQSLPCLTAPL